MTKQTIDFFTRQYELAHGKSPKGYGSWAFIVMDGIDEKETIWATGTYAEAKKQARTKISQYYPDIKYLEVCVGS